MRPIGDFDAILVLARPHRLRVVRGSFRFHHQRTQIGSFAGQLHRYIEKVRANLGDPYFFGRDFETALYLGTDVLVEVAARNAYPQR